MCEGIAFVAIIACICAAVCVCRYFDHVEIMAGKYEPTYETESTDDVD